MKLLKTVTGWCDKHSMSMLYGLLTVIYMLIAVGYAWLAGGFGKQVVEMFREECDD